MNWSKEAARRPSVVLYDTTLRDGTQGEDVSFSVEDKLKITALLDDLGVAYVEGGWPGSNPKDAEYFSRLSSLRLRTTKVAAFGMTCRVGSRPEDDTSVQALVSSGVRVVTIVGKSSLFHVREVLRTTPEENRRLIHDTVKYLKGLGLEVVYDAEHFFDGYKLDSEYALSTLESAASAGADCLVLCDTNGGSMPWEVGAMVEAVGNRWPEKTVGIHSHNDSEMAVANTVAAVRAGAKHIQGTINGYGERCGNANLCSLAPLLELKMGTTCLPTGALARLTELARTVAETANLAPAKNLPYVGLSAFAHKGGMHAAAMRRHPDSYQHVDPTLFGNRSRILVSDLAGRGNLLSKAEEFEMDVDPHTASQIATEIKELESCGYSFEGAEASIAMLFQRREGSYQVPFELLSLRAVIENCHGLGSGSEATVKLGVGEQVVHTVGEGNGPIDAIDTALRKALLPIYPHLQSVRLADYKVRILDGDKGPAATTRVLIDFRSGSNRWTTVGASPNIIEASFLALKDAFEYAILEVGDARQVLSAAG
jgi:2-isopropylmalate synthase